MGKLGTIFGMVAALLAIVAAVLSFLISGKRALYEERAGKLADTVAKMVGKLDQNSNSGVPAAVSFTVADKAAGTAEDGSLAWKKYLEDANAFGTNLDQAVTLAGKLNLQRDGLAEAMGKTASVLGMDVDPATLRDVSNEAQFGTAVASISGHAEAVSERDKAMQEALLKAAETISHPVDATVLSKREETTDAEGNAVQGQFPCKGPLDEFTGNIKGLVTRCNDYADAIGAAINGVTKHTWQANADKIKDEREYGGVLTSLQNDFAEINEQLALYEQAKKEVAEQKTRISQLVEELEETSAELKDTKKDLTKIKGQLDRVRKSIGDFGGPEGGPDPNITGEIIEVNDQWNFVIVNLGRNSRVQENLKMLVARQDRLVARLQISKVLGKFSVAEILPEANVEAVKIGDRVLLPKAQEE